MLRDGDRTLLESALERLGRSAEVARLRQLTGQR
jgi:hypothetical protein